jgi:membrane-bound serine protease (ClpP class)
MEPITWSVLCCILMVVAVAMEALTPSVGFFTLLAVGLAAGSVWLGFRQSAPAGYVMLGVNVVFFPAALAATIHFLKHSPLLLHKVVAAGVPREPVAPQPAHELLGQEGQALTTLRPAGTAVFGDRRVDVVTDGKFVEAGTKVRVIKVSGSIVVVEPIG